MLYISFEIRYFSPMRVAFFTLILLCNLGTSSFAQTATAVPAPLNADETRFSQILNQFRTALNLPALTLQAQLESVARMHSDWMTANNLLSHYEPVSPTNGPFDRMAALGYSQYFYAGENIACGNSDAMKTFRQWAFSPGHLLNMINPHYHDMGIARSGPSTGTCPWFWTNDFGSMVNPAEDSAGTTDLNLITAAIIQVSGPIPPGITVSLTEPTPTPTPVPVQAIGVNANAAVSSIETTITSLHCTIPYSVGRDILTTFNNTDTELDATRESDGSYSVKLSYLQNGQASNIYPILMSDLTMIRNPDYPVFTLISAPGSRVGGYSIEVDLGANHAQFDSYGVTPQVTASLACTVKY